MSRYIAEEIVAPSTESLSPHTMRVTFNRTTKDVTGLEPLVNIGGGAIVCANNGIKDFWFRCRSIQAAREVLENYSKGNYLTLQWFKENSK